MNCLSISRFKAQALAVIKAVHDTGRSVVVTKRGKPLAIVIPYRPDFESAPRTGRLQGTLAFEKDLIAPLDTLTVSGVPPSSPPEHRS